MSQSDLVSRMTRYGAAVLCVVVATMARFALGPILGDEVPFITYFPAVVAAAWFGGFRPALLAIVLSALGANYFFIPERGTLGVQTLQDQVTLGLFLFMGGVCALFAEALQGARRRAEANAAARRLAEEQVRREHGRLLTTLASIGDAVIATDVKGRITLMNGVAEELTGWKASEARGRQLDEVFRIINEESRQPVESPVIKALREGRAIGLANHTLLIARDGTERPIADSAAPIQDGQDEIIGVVLVFRDAGEQRQYEERLREQTRIAQTLHRVGTALAGEFDLQRLVQLVTDEAVALTGASFGAFFYNLRGEAGERYTLFTISGVPREAFAGFPMPRNTAIFEPTFRGQGPVRLDDVTKDPRYGKNEPYFGMPEGHLPVRSYLAVPVVARSGDVLGGLFFGHPEAGRFTDAHERLAVGIAAQAAVAIDNARLFSQVQTSERRLQVALRAGRMGTWDWDFDINRVVWSPGLETIFGLPAGGLPSTFDVFERYVHPDDRARLSAEITDAQQERRDFLAEFRIIWPNGTIRWIESRGRPEFEGDRPVRMTGVCVDIDDRKRAEVAAHFLADASASLATLVDYQSTLQKVARLAVPAFADWCAVDMVEADGSLTRLAVAHVDSGKVRIAHELHRRYPPDPNAPRGAYHVVRTGQAEWLAEIPDELLVQSAPDEDYLRIVRELGLRSYICAPLAVRDRVLGLLTFVTAESGRHYTKADLELAIELGRRAAIAVENSLLYAQLREADRRKDEFLAVLAHELRNPLAPVRNAVGVMRLREPQDESIRWARDVIGRQVEQMTRLIDDLLDISRISRGKIEMKLQPVELGEVVRRAVETTRPLIEERRHDLTLHLLPGPVPLRADPSRLEQVFANLLSNAAKYTEPGGRIRVESIRDGGMVEVRVSDTGVGIEPGHLPHIFDIFVQADPDRDQARGGLGIGLSLVRSLVERQGGTVSAASAGPGQGSTFIVRLPIDDGRSSESGSVASSTSAAQATSRTPHAQKVLVVDDNEDAAESLAMVLRLYGHEVRVAHSGDAALELARAEMPQAAFLDIGMPGMDGLELARRIRRLPGGESILLTAVTGWGQEEDRRRSFEAGFDHHFTKPVVIADIQQLLTNRI